MAEFKKRVVLGHDGTNYQKVKTDSDGHIQADVLSTANPSNLDVALSTRASESTLSSIDGKITKCDTDNVLSTSKIQGHDGTEWRNIKTDADGHVQADVLSTANPSNLDVALSTRASESTLNDINTKITKCDTDNVTATAKIQGYDGTNWQNIKTDSNGQLMVVLVEG